MADLGSGRYSDIRFSAMAREFKCALLFATQSMSALSGNAEALLANFNNRIMFYNDDPATQIVPHRYGSYDLTQLQPQQAFVCRYDQRARRHIVGLETLNSAFALGREYRIEVPQAATPVAAPPIPRLCETVKNLKLDSPASECNPINPGETQMNSTTSQIAESFDLAARFPQFFVDGSPEIAIPVGWRPFVNHAFNALAASGLEPKIASLALGKSGRGETLQAHSEGTDPEDTEHDPGIILLNRLLDDVTERCPFCGKRSNPAFGRSSARMTICTECLRHYGLSEPEPTSFALDDEDDDDMEPDG